MNSLLNRAHPVGAALPSIARAPVSEPVIEDYLDHLCAPLIGIVPFAERLRLRLETADHLLALRQDYEADGLSPNDALAAALREYGAPWALGQSFADAWLEHDASGCLARFADAPTLRAFGWFGVLAVANLMAVEWSVYQPTQSQMWLPPLVQYGVIAAPLIAGALTGAGLDSRTSPAICGIVALLALISAAVGLLLLPAQTGLHFALAQFVLWPPLGCLAAALAGGMRRRFLLRAFRFRSALN